MSTTQNEFVQQPLDVGIYEMDWAAKYLAGTGDTAGNLLAFTFAANADGFVALAQTAIGDPVPAGIVRVRCAGGINGGAYKVTARIATTQGREKEWDIAVLVREL
jgi:F420-0:gamma-glutamyl ligase